MNNRRPEELLAKGVDELGLPISRGQIDAFMIYLSELKRWNRAYNLTGLKKDEDIVIKHFLDSLLYLKVLPQDAVIIADVGSGAGFPGMPIKIMRPETEMYLVEPTGKKAAFLRHMIKPLLLNKVHVIEKRVEATDPRDMRAPADAAVTRALFDVGDFMKKASHIVKAGGTLILNKGPKAEEELKALKGAAFEILSCRLPLTDITRHIIVLRTTEG